MWNANLYGVWANFYGESANIYGHFGIQDSDFLENLESIYLKN